MTKEELIQYVEVGSTNSVCVDRRLLLKYKNIVRDVIIRKDFLVQIEFNTHGHDEGGLVVDVYFENYDSLISSLESYLYRRILCWENVNKSGWYPELSKAVDLSEGSTRFENDLSKGKIRLPLDGEKYEIRSSYWKNIVGYIVLGKEPIKSSNVFFWGHTEMFLDTMGEILVENKIVDNYEVDAENVYEWISCDFDNGEYELNISIEHDYEDPVCRKNNVLEFRLIENNELKDVTLARNCAERETVEALARKIADTLNIELSVGNIEYNSKNKTEYIEEYKITPSQS